MANPSARGSHPTAHRNEILAGLRERLHNELKPNLFGIVIDHGLSCWGRRSTWENTIARVTDLENTEHCRPPYFSGAIVRATPPRRHVRPGFRGWQRPRERIRRNGGHPGDARDGPRPGAPMRARRDAHL
jgi:hypothetical protein